MADIKLGASALDGFYIGSTAVDKIYVGDVELFSAAPPFDSGLLENGTFGDSTGVNIPSGGWEVTGGTLNYLTGGAKKVRLNLSTDMVVGNTYDITFTISNAVNARMAWYAGNQNELIEGNTDRGDGTYTISGYTHTVADRGEVSIVAQTSGGGTTFSIDNIAVAEAPVANLYNFVNAVSYDDIDSNTGWSATSNFFANSITSTDAGENFSIGIITRSTNVSSTSSLSHTLPTLTISQDYKMTIRYKMDYDAATAPVQNPFFNWSGVSNTTYPSVYSDAGQFVDVEVLFTATSATPSMKIYPHYNNGTGRTLNDTLEISSILIEEVVVEELFTGNAAADADSEVNATTGFSTLGNTSVAVNSTDQHTGTYCIELENGAAGGGFDRVEYDITVENAAQYNVSLWARELVGSDGRIQLWDGVTGWSTVVLTNTWTEYTATVTATSTTMKMRFYPNNGSGAAGDKILLDNISVTKV